MIDTDRPRRLEFASWTLCRLLGLYFPTLLSDGVHPPAGPDTANDPVTSSIL